MKKLLLPLLIIIIVAACNSTKNTTAENALQEEFDTNVIVRPYNGAYDITIQQSCISCGDCYVTFYNNVYLYTTPDTNSTKLDTLSFNTQFERQYFTNSYNHQNIDWLKIKYKGKYAFVNHRKLVTIEQNVTNPTYNRDVNYLVGNIEYDNELGHQIAIKKYNPKNNELLNEITLPKVSTFNFSFFNSSTLNKYEPIMYYRSSRESCPGTTYEAFIIDNGDQLVKLAEGTSEGEGGYYDVTNIYLPMYYSEDSVILATYVEPHNYYYNPYWKNQYSTFPYPKDIGVPIENLIVVFSEGADEDTSWMDNVYERIKAYDNGDDIDDDDEFLYVHYRDTQYFEYKDGVVTPIDYPKKNK